MLFNELLLYRPGDVQSHFAALEHQEFIAENIDILRPKLYGITVTISDQHLTRLKSVGKNVFDFYHYLLRELGYKGIIIGEYAYKTKRPHIHGVVIIENIKEDYYMEKYTKKTKRWYRNYQDLRIPYQTLIEPYTAIKGINKTLRYITKDIPSPTIMEWLQRE